MSRTVERVAGALYRAGLKHEDGTTSIASLNASPTRIVVGEVVSSIADVLTGWTEPRPTDASRPITGR